ncbi:hypothetical protein PR202_ga08460 [Eleusine coracana subsp. coracana]|uniref:Uncharacterized protein n=1 Tax=Eleusine coracana subsp. coracana TaxID=191504 RepID=A0AAV5C2J4_ELECO|nr:hypothetical protein PR202_ga08460 [Eleusine coracana subsp. coracana]
MSPRPSTDWGSIIVSVILFVVLSPGLLFQLPARTRVVEFGNMATRHLHPRPRHHLLLPPHHLRRRHRRARLRRLAV